MKQKTEITFEVKKTIILPQVGKTLKVFCPQWQALVQIITPLNIAVLSSLSERQIFRLIEAAGFHFSKPIEFLFAGIL